MQRTLLRLGVPRNHHHPKIVLTHSTYLPGLTKFLNLLAADPAVSKLIPARINTVSASADKFDFRLTTNTPTGVKALARLNRSVQEVFVITKDRVAVQFATDKIISLHSRKLK